VPHPHAVYESIARSVHAADYEPHPEFAGHFVRVRRSLTRQGVAALDRVIQAGVQSGGQWDDVVRTLRIDGRPLPIEYLAVAEQLRIARETGLLQPGD
jgi:hypothetical protein